jgi:hypothetical protein
MKLKSLEVKQKKIIRFVKSYFTKDNSPFIKKNYFALFEDGDGMREIQKNIFNLKKNDKKYSLIKIINFIKNFNYDVSSIKVPKVKVISYLYFRYLTV